MKPANRAPIYTAMVYPELAEICRKHGYALAVHGSLARDFDLIAIPWADTVSTYGEVIAEITQTFAVKQVGKPERKMHSRWCYILSWCGDAFMDFSFIEVNP